MTLDIATKWGILTKTRANFARDIWDSYLALNEVSWDKLESDRTYWARTYSGGYGNPGQVWKIGAQTPSKRKTTIQKIKLDGNYSLPLSVNLSSLREKTYRMVDEEIYDLFYYLDDKTYNEYLIEAHKQGLEISPAVLKENIHLLRPDCPRFLDEKVFDYMKIWDIDRLNEEVADLQKRLNICKWLIDFKSQDVIPVNKLT